MKYRPEIDGLRAVAVISVILNHAGFAIFGGGYVGVDIFFVISGYLITTIILSELSGGSFSLARFYERRARRILPALYVITTVSLVSGWFFLAPSDYKEFFSSLMAVTTFTSNIYFWKTINYFSQKVEMIPLIHTWSLGVEEQYYIIFPLFAISAYSLGKRFLFFSMIVVGVASLFGAQYASSRMPAAAFYLLPTRGWELLIGSATAVILMSERAMIALGVKNHIIGATASATGILMCAYSVFTYNNTTPYPSIYTLPSTIGTALLIVYTYKTKSMVKTLLSSLPLVGIGLISYSAYLWHQPALVMLRNITITKPNNMLICSTIILIFAISYFSWKYIERPFRDKRLTSTSFIVATLSCVGIILLAFGYVGRSNHGFEGRFELPTTLKNSFKYGSRQSECWTAPYKADNPDKFCPLGGGEDKPSFMLTGDSHSFAVLPAFDIRPQALAPEGSMREAPGVCHYSG